MRNIFDQYSFPENRLSHALATCLNEDPNLLDAFLLWASASPPKRGTKLRVVEQRIPNALEPDETERRGLPDIWIRDDHDWCLLIESKIEAPLTVDQIARHVRTAQRAGHSDIHVLTLTMAAPTIALRPEWASRKWTELYAFATSARASAWAKRLVEYMEVAETKLSEEYMKSGTLTAFEGIRFDEEHPYSYLQAKRLLRLLVEKLRERQDLVELGMDPAGLGRPALTRGVSVWDIIPLRGAGADDPFRKYPHLTISLHPAHINVMVTMPDGVRREIRRHLLALGEERFCSVVDSVGAEVARALRHVEKARPTMFVLQRHYASRRSPIVDAHLEFDLRTCSRTPPGLVKSQPEWTETVFRLLESKQSNIQVQIGAQLPYSSPVVGSRGLVDAVAGTWIACRSWLAEALGIPSTTPRPKRARKALSARLSRRATRS